MCSKIRQRSNDNKGNNIKPLAPWSHYIVFKFLRVGPFGCPDCDSSKKFRWQPIATFWHEMKGPRYDGKYLKDLVDKLLGPTKLNQTLTKVVIPTFDLKDMHPVIFSSYEASANSSKNAKLSDICLGTSAVPTYLPAYYFKNYYDAVKYREYNLIDGGIVANNLLIS
ncbi:patatin-like protein 1 [Tanacetum coccineum]